MNKNILIIAFVLLVIVGIYILFGTKNKDTFNITSDMGCQCNPKQPQTDKKPVHSLEAHLTELCEKQRDFNPITFNDRWGDSIDACVKDNKHYDWDYVGLRPHMTTEQKCNRMKALGPLYFSNYENIDDCINAFKIHAI